MTGEPNDEWINLSGCNACINKTLCAAIGNCALLSVNEKYPDNNKAKRRYIQRLRTATATEILLHQWELSKEVHDSDTYTPPEVVPYIHVRLTRLEQLFIEALKKPR